MPRVRIFLPARRAIVDIWRYTNETWGPEQADQYVRGLYDATAALADDRMRWRRVDRKPLAGVFFVRYEHHYIFFRELADRAIGIISVLHENMDLPARLDADVDEAQRDV